LSRQPSPTRRHALTVLAAGSAALLAACAVPVRFAPVGPSTAGGTMRLRIGTAITPPPALPDSVLWLAQSLGLYEQEGLDVALVELQATPSVIAAMRAGDVDVGNVNSEDVIRLVATHAFDVRTISSSNGRNLFMIVGNGSVGSPAELAGKTFAIARPGSQDDALSRKVLTANGVALDTVRFVAVGEPSQRAQALLVGQIDATTMSLATWVTIQHTRDLRIVLSADDYFDAVPLVNKGNAVAAEALSEQPEALRRFTVTLLKASRYFAQNMPAWVDQMAQLRPDMARPDLAYLWSQFGASWAVNGQLNLADYQRSTDFLYDSGAFDDAPHIQASDWTDTRFVDAALANLGVYRGVDDPGRQLG
jgi:NitT/TauT family transport system substrate-binding protein